MSDAPQPPPSEPSSPAPAPTGGWSAPPPTPPPAPQPPPPAPGWQQPPPPQQTWAPTPAEPAQWVPGPVYRPPTPGPGAGPAPAPPTSGARLYVGLALVVAGASVVLAVLVAILTIDAAEFSFIDFTFTNRLQNGTAFVTLPVVLVLPLALLLAHDDAAPERAGLARTVVLGATVLGATFSVLALVRLVANLAGDDLFVATSTAGALFFDLACLLVAVASTSWGSTLLRRPARPPAPEPERSIGSPWAPPTMPPRAPPPPSDWPPFQP